MNVMITGGAGFIGSHLNLRLLSTNTRTAVSSMSTSSPTRGNLANLSDIEDRPNYTFVKADICDYDEMLRIMKAHVIDGPDSSGG